MRCLHHFFLIIPLLCTFFILGCSDNADDKKYKNEYYQLATKKPLAEVLDDTLFAITERNFRLTSHLHIGQAIRDRGNDDFPDYEVLLYCNLSYAKEMLDAEPNSISFCPHRIAIRQDDNRVLITAPLWPKPFTNDNLGLLKEKMNVLVREIVDYAAEDWLTVYGVTTPATLK